MNATGAIILTAGLLGAALLLTRAGGLFGGAVVAAPPKKSGAEIWGGLGVDLIKGYWAKEYWEDQDGEGDDD